jgi:hypothetical protein
VLALYPLAWRERYGEELAALLEDDPPGARALVDLARGALLAHLRRGPRPAAHQQMLGSVSAILAAFIAFCFAGGAFAKSTENIDKPGVINDTHHVIVLAAWIALGALVLAAAPLALRALAQARGRPKLRALVAAPALAIGVLAATFGLFALLRSKPQHGFGALDWALLALVGVAAVVGAFVCWSAPRELLARLDVRRETLAISLPALAIVAIAMALISVATAIYLVALPGPLAATADGPLRLPMALDIALTLAVMVALSAAAALSAWRGLDALAGKS